MVPAVTAAGPMLTGPMCAYGAFVIPFMVTPLDAFFEGWFAS